MVAHSAQRVMRRLTTAEGYLELGMPDQALLELQSIIDPGPFSVPHLLMTAAALKAQGRTDEASESLRQVAKSLPKVTGDAWKSLGKFLKKMGQSVEPADLQKILASVGFKQVAEEEVVAPVEPAPSAVPAGDEIRIDIPHFGTFSVKVENGQSLTIKIERPNAASGPAAEVKDDDESQ